MLYMCPNVRDNERNERGGAGNGMTGSLPFHIEMREDNLARAQSVAPARMRNGASELGARRRAGLQI
jgi:hypothetical protein